MAIKEDEADFALSSCWQTAAFVGAAFGGKLRKLSRYKKDRKKSESPKISKEEFEIKLAEAERRRTIGS